MNHTDMINLIHASAVGLQEADPRTSRSDMLKAALCCPLKVCVGVYKVIVNISEGGGFLQYLFSCRPNQNLVCPSHLFQNLSLNDHQVRVLREKQMLFTSHEGNGIWWFISEDLYVYAFYGMTGSFGKNMSKLLKTTILTMVMMTTTFLRQSHMIRSAEREMNTDPLTQLPNRRKIGDLWSNIFTQFFLGRISRLYLAICDIDLFKKVNDTYGHQAGDDVLKAVAKALRSGLGSGEYVGRWGGEEFVLMTCTEQTLVNVHQAISNLSVVTSDLKGHSVTLQVTLTMGVLQMDNAKHKPEHGLADLLEQADRALYKGKKSGRNRIVYVND